MFSKKMLGGHSNFINRSYFLPIAHIVLAWLLTQGWGELINFAYLAAISLQIASTLSNRWLCGLLLSWPHWLCWHSVWYLWCKSCELGGSCGLLFLQILVVKLLLLVVLGLLDFRKSLAGSDFLAGQRLSPAPLPPLLQILGDLHLNSQSSLTFELIVLLDASLDNS